MENRKKNTFEVDVFWAVTPCRVVVGYQRFTGPCCLHLPQHYTAVITHKTSTWNITAVKVSKLLKLFETLSCKLEYILSQGCGYWSDDAYTGQLSVVYTSVAAKYEVYPNRNQRKVAVLLPRGLTPTAPASLDRISTHQFPAHRSRGACWLHELKCSPW